jgi:hypothetical protein
MEKSGNSSAAARIRIAIKDMEKFSRLIEGHRKLLAAIGGL